MNRKRTATGLALLALLVASVAGGMVTLAHSEEVNGEFTATNTATGKHVAAKYDGVQITESKFQDEGWEIKCEKVKFEADSKAGTDMLLTVTASYEECDAFYQHDDELRKFPVTVDMNKCHYEFEQPIEQKKDVYSGPINIICGTEPIELIVYELGNTKLHSGVICTFNLYETIGRTKTTYEDDTLQKPTDFIIDADITELPYEEQGVTCPDETNQVFPSGKLIGRSTITATTADGKKTQIDASVD